MLLFSSIASAIGNVGQACYAAANASLDSLTAYRTALGAVSCGLQLPFVAGAGMGQAGLDAGPAVSLDQLAKVRGMAPISLEQYAACLARLVELPGRVVSPLPLGVRQLRACVPDESLPALSELVLPAAAAPSASPSAPAATGPLTDALAALPPARQQPHVEALVLGVLRELTGAADVGAGTPLMEAGVDSLAATEMSMRLRAATGLPLSPTLVFEHPTPRDIAAHLLSQIVGSREPSRAVPSGGAEAGRAVGLHGLAGRWPGGCAGRAALSSMLHASGDAVGAVPSSRWELSSAVDVSRLSEVQRSCVSHGGFVAGAAHFDAASFGVSPAEAAAMDPQQRLLLEVGYEALHGAGARRSSLLGGGEGVFVGIERPDWALLSSLRPSSVYAVTGDTTSVACGRLSFVLGMQGPCMSVDTACASALVALHGAWRAARSGDCDGAIAAAVSLKLVPHPTLGAAAAGMLSVDGRCKTFDAAANGYARSEGVGAATVRVDAAASACSLATVSGGAVRQDGRSASLTAPNGSAQRRLLSAAAASAGLASTAALSGVAMRGAAAQGWQWALCWRF